MPTTGPRIQVALDDTTYETIRRLSKASRLSMSRICADVMEQAAPLLARSTRMLEDAARLSEEAKVQLRLDLAREEKVITRAAGHAFGALASAEEAIRKAATPPRVGAKRAPGEGGRRSAKTGVRRRPRTPGQ